MRQPGGRTVAWVTLSAAAAALVVLAGGGVIVVLNAPEPTQSVPAPSAPEPHGPPEPAPAAVAQHEAEDLRTLARADCSAARWADCIAKLDRAADLDLTGNLTRSVQRMRLEATRAAKLNTQPSELDATARARFAAMLRGDAGAAAIRLQLVCEPEPRRLCDQLAATMKKAGWVVSRSTLAGTEGGVGTTHGQRIEVATDADASTQDAADVLAEALAASGIVPRGPDDMAPVADAPRLKLTMW